MFLHRLRTKKPNVGVGRGQHFLWPPIEEEQLPERSHNGRFAPVWLTKLQFCRSGSTPILYRYCGQVIANREFG